jgi:hypothetical protein
MARRLINRNREREQRQQSLLLDRLTVRFRGRVRRAIASAMRDMINHWEHTNEVAMPRGYVDQIAAEYQAMSVASISEFAKRITGQAKSESIPLEIKESFVETMTRWAFDYIRAETVRKRITSIAETTRQQVINAIDRGFADGLGQAGVATYVRGLVPEFSRYRAEMIARTETHGAANYGAGRAARETNLPLNREWIAAGDERTRETHTEADGQIVGMDEPFTVGGAKLMYPGDPDGPAEEVINCRCSVGFIVDESRLFDENQPEPQPQPQTKPGQQFSYQTAQMPQTSEEAGKFIIQSGIALNSRLDGMKIPAMQGALRASLEVTERYGLEPITGIGPATRFGLKNITKANAAVVQGSIYQGGQYIKINVLHLPTKFGDTAEYGKQNALGLKNASRRKAEAALEITKLQAANKIDARVLNLFSKLQESEYSWTYFGLQPASEMAKIIVYHEYGHVLHLIDKTASKEINAFLSKEKPRSKGWQYLVSEYAGEDNMEYIAETFSIYMHAPKSQWYRIHPELLNIYQRLDRKK